MSGPLLDHSNRIKNFDQLDQYLGGTGGVNILEKRYLIIQDEEIVVKVKNYAKGILKNKLQERHNPKDFRNSLLNLIGYTDALIAKYGILMVAARRKLDKEAPGSLITILEEKLSIQIETLLHTLNLSSKTYWPWMSIFSYPSRIGGDCHPWISQLKETLGLEVVETAKRIRDIINLYQATAMRWIEKRVDEDSVVKLKNITQRLQNIHYWSEKDELEEPEDLYLTNKVIDNFCTHFQEHQTLEAIRNCPSVKQYLDIKLLKKIKLAMFILVDDHFGEGKNLKNNSLETGMKFKN